MIARRFLIAISLLLGAGANAQNSVSPNLCQVRDRALEYVVRQQIQSDTEVYKKGEWPSKVSLSGIAHSLGLLKTGPFEDPNVFTTASIHNILGEIYIKYRRDERLPNILKTASNSMSLYLTKNGSFDFWPWAPSFSGDVHVPHFQITNNLVAGLVAVPADADDTAVAQLAYYLDRQICDLNHDNDPSSCSTLDPNVERFFTPFLDTFRIPAPSNLLRGEFATGAYLTWLQDEPLWPRVVHIFAPQSNGSRIVLDKNDVDCVVNANVLRTLTLYGKTDAAGYADACHLLEADATSGDFNSCGDYYPDTYWYHYSVARAYADGVTCLKRSADIALAKVMKKQKADGHWTNEVMSDGDALSTAFALGTLMKIGDPNDPRQQSMVKKGIQYLLSTSQIDDQGLNYWSGGIFFSAGVPARKDVLWYSDSFTTAIVALLLYDASVWLPQSSLCAIPTS